MAGQACGSVEPCRMNEESEQRFAIEGERHMLDCAHNPSANASRAGRKPGISELLSE